MKNFVIIGAAGYIAPRHMRAIRDTGNNLIAALDPSDSVGIIDNFFPKASFFTEFERFDRHIEKIKRKGVNIDYVVVCSPNYLHDAHCRFGLRHGADVICEKPIVLNPWNIAALQEIENETNNRIYNILQLRLHPHVVKLRKSVLDGPNDKIYEVDLTYLTSRGNWYFASWKGDVNKSGGIATNIGVHFFDMLLWIFGPLRKSKVHVLDHDRASGYLTLAKAHVKWFLSINDSLLPDVIRENEVKTHRLIVVDGEKIEISNGFADLHTMSYHDILSGEGFGLNETKPAIELVNDIRHSIPELSNDNSHNMAHLTTKQHPFKG